MKGLKVQNDQSLIYQERSDEEYGSWRSDYTNEVTSIELVDKHPDVVTSLDIKSGDIIYLVWVERSTGDSFGWANNNEVEFEGVFIDPIHALHFSRFLEASAKLEICNRTEEYVIKQLHSNELQHHLKYIDVYNDNGMKLKYTAGDKQEFIYRSFPWEGYFDKLEAVHVTEMIVE